MAASSTRLGTEFFALGARHSSGASSLSFLHGAAPALRSLRSLQRYTPPATSLARSVLVTRRGGRTDRRAAHTADDRAAERTNAGRRADHRTGAGADRTAGDGTGARIAAAGRQREKGNHTNHNLVHGTLLYDFSRG